LFRPRSKDAPNFHIDERGSLQKTTEGIALDVKRKPVPGKGQGIPLEQNGH